jgi:hypothetical protein
MLKASVGFDIFSKALRTFQNLNGKKIRDNILVIAEVLPDMLRMIIANFALIETTIVSMGGVLGTALATMIFTAFNTFNALLVASGGSIIAGIGSIIVGIIYGVLLVVKEFLETIVKPGSILWDILDTLGQFLVQAAEYVGYYGVYIVVKFFEGVIGAIEDLGWTNMIISKINDIVDGVKHWWNDHVANPFAQSINDLFATLATARSRLASGINNARISEIQDELGQYVYNSDTGKWERSTPFGWFEAIDQDRPARLQAELEELQAAAEQYQADMDDIAAYHDQQAGEITDFYESQNEYASTIHDAVQTMLDEEAAARNIFEHAPDYEPPAPSREYSTYMPDQYRGLAMDLQKVDEASEGASDGIFNFGQRLRETLGLSEDQSFGDALLGFLGIGNIEDFTQTGESDGSSWVNGFGSALENASIPNTDSILNMDTSNIDYGEFSSALSNAVSLPEEAKNPVISPVLDDTKFWSDFGQFENTWNEKTYDQFAIDADSSMLLREQAQGDAATNGEVTYSFTQINNSPRELSPIQLYRDGRNLLRGSGTFRAT